MMLKDTLNTSFTEQIRSRLKKVTSKPLASSTLIPAAVMLLVFEKQGDYHILFNKRSQQVEHHKGEIAFPGGVYDDGDETLTSTALRETWEEMGIKASDVEVLGQLSELSTRTNFRIVPFVGSFNHPYNYRPNPTEVAEVIEVPIDYLLDPQHVWAEMHMWNGERRREYYYSYQNHVIYGATARILHQFLNLLD